MIRWLRHKWAIRQIAKHNIMWWQLGRLEEWQRCPCEKCERARKYLLT